MKKNSLDTQFQFLLQDILDNGHIKGDRTGTGTKSVFGRTIRHDMKEGFPLLTSKKIFTKAMVTELKWFLKGDTNIQYLVQNGCNIWNGDAYKAYTKYPLATMTDHHTNILYKNLDKGWCMLSGRSMSSPHPTRHLTKDEFIDKIKTDDEFTKRWGDLGPIYGKQWREWDGYMGEKTQFVEPDGDGHGYYTQIPHYYKGIDQLKEQIHTLKTNPDSRRIMVTAWNPAEIKEAVLPPCHYGFQFYTRELSLDERYELAGISDPAPSPWQKPHFSEIQQHELLDDIVPQRRSISLSWNQRSVDTFLGLPFNIASYGLLLILVAKEVNMIPEEIIGFLGDTHLYLNHLEQAKEQIGRKLTSYERSEMYESETYQSGIKMGGIWTNWKEDKINNFDNQYAHEWLDKWASNVPKRTREPRELPTIEITNLDILNGEFDYELKDYNPHPSIKAPLSN